MKRPDDSEERYMVDASLVLPEQREKSVITVSYDSPLMLFK